MKKIRVNFNITERQHSLLKLIGKSKGLSASDLLRRILDEWLDRFERDNKLEDE